MEKWDENGKHFPFGETPRTVKTSSWQQYRLHHPATLKMAPVVLTPAAWR